MNIIIFVTASNVKEAKRIAQALLEKKLVACANILHNVSSFFWWEEKIDHANEALLILKTKRSKFKKITQVVKSKHSYTVPEIIALPIILGEKKYLRWIDATLR